MTTTNLNRTERSRLNDILRTALVEILGEIKTKEILGQSKTPCISLSRLHQQLEKSYGISSTGGIEHRVGQACFRYFIQRMGSELGFCQSTYKFLPIKQKVLTGINLMAGLYERVFKDKVQFTEDESAFILNIGCDNSMEHSESFHGCDFTVGFLKEFMSWIGNGKVYLVIEEECRNKRHDHCIYHISKVPLD